MLGQDDDGIDRERMCLALFTESQSQQVGVFRQQALGAFRQRHREEESTAGDRRADVVRHGVRAAVGFATLHPPSFATLRSHRPKHLRHCTEPL